MIKKAGGGSKRRWCGLPTQTAAGRPAGTG